MPAFDQLGNQEIADLVTFIRAGWGNHANPISPQEVAKVRTALEAAEANR